MTVKFVERKSCPKCDRTVAFKTNGDPYKHTCTGDLTTTCTCGTAFVSVDGEVPEHECVSDPAPTVDAMDDNKVPWLPEHDENPAARELALIGGVGVSDDECEHPNGFTEHGCPCGASQPDDDFDTPAPVKVPAADPQPAKGPWFGAMYDGECSDCDGAFYEGDRIRADGKGRYECEDCGEAPDRLVAVTAKVSDWQAQASAAAKRALNHLNTPAPVVEIRVPALTEDDFDTPATVEQQVKLNVSGQPNARRDYLGRYIVVDPGLGDFRRTKKERKPFGITRATTFNKHAQNTIALNGWSKRNVVMGASLRPDILRRAHGLHHDTSKEQRETLDRIVGELEVAAGAKVSADEGTFLHEFCDQVDAGLKTWQDAPAMYQQDIKRYVEALEKAGLEPAPGLIERTTFIREFGGVAGTFDRIFYHRPSGQYIIGDLKTGKTMKYAMDETECQEWTYAHGVNQTGIYDWNTDAWGPTLHGCECESHVSDEDCAGPRFITVSEKVGVIVHMPVQGPEAGEVYLRYADLERGRAYAELNYAVNSYPKSKVRPFEDFYPKSKVRPLEMPAAPTWEERFSAATSGEHANQLWREAKADGVEGVRLNELVALARIAIAAQG